MIFWQFGDSYPNPSHNSSHVATWLEKASLIWSDYLGAAQEVFGYVAHWCSMWKNGNCLQTKPWAFLMINMRPATMEVKSAWWLPNHKRRNLGFPCLIYYEIKVGLILPTQSASEKRKKTPCFLCEPPIPSQIIPLWTLALCLVINPYEPI